MWKRLRDYGARSGDTLTAPGSISLAQIIGAGYASDYRGGAKR